jgi:CDP-diacylglycerol--glycerol-3-phosphate 3-phosphatidyltransferase
MANLLSLLRLASTAPFAWWLAQGGAGNAALATTLFCVAIASDLADGRIARARGTASPLGRALDHGADFAFVTSGLAAAAARGLVPWLLPALVAFAFAQYVVDSYWLHRARQLRMSALGRWNGILYFVPVGAALAAELGLAIAAPIARASAWLLVVSTLASIADRALAAWRAPQGESCT